MAGTTKLGLPLITGNMTWDVVRDANALANAVDAKAGVAGGLATLGAGGKVPAGQLDVDTSGLATKTELQAVKDDGTTHKADYLKHTGYAVATGSANAYIATLNPALSAYAESVSLRLKINVANTGASTVNVNGLGAKAIKKSNGNAVASGNLKVGSIYTLAYDGTSFILQGEGGEYGTAVAGDVLSGKSIGTESGLVLGAIPDYSLHPSQGNYVGAKSARGDGMTSLVVEPLPGYYTSGVNASGYGTILAHDPQYVPDNIRKGISIFGVVGTVQEGIKSAAGVFDIALLANGNTRDYNFDCGFVPSNVIVSLQGVTRLNGVNVTPSLRLPTSNMIVSQLSVTGNTLTIRVKADGGDYITNGVSWKAFA